MISLVIGASGLVGSYICKYLKDLEEQFYGTYFSKKINDMVKLDIKSNIDVELLLPELKVDVIYVPAAIPGVDYCEKNPVETYKTNVVGVNNIVEANLKLKKPAKIVYFSSEYIFDGINGPYSEVDTPNPINEYGKQKLASEMIITGKSKNYLIVRTVWVYGIEENRKNFMYYVIDRCGKGEKINVPEDEYSNPTYAKDIPKAIKKLLDKKYNGVMNIAGPDRVSKFEFANRICEIFELEDNYLNPVKSDSLDRPAKRPRNAGLKTGLSSKFDVRMIQLKDALKEIKFEGV